MYKSDNTLQSRRKTGICETCGQKMKDHTTCSLCGELMGPNHEETIAWKKDDDILCSSCLLMDKQPTQSISTKEQGEGLEYLKSIKIVTNRQIETMLENCCDTNASSDCKKNCSVWKECQNEYDSLFAAYTIYRLIELQKEHDILNSLLKAKAEAEIKDD